MTVQTAPRKRSQRTALLILGVIAVLAIGFALGVLARIPFGDDSAAPAIDSVDVGFSQDMTVHHSQAIDMASVALTNSSSQDVRTLAFDILTSQQNQVGQMQGWLALWDRPPLPTDGYMQWMTDDSSGHGMSGMSTAPNDPVAVMPGMATSDELVALRQATGPALDVMFLQLMLRHHQGGLPMMEDAQTNAETGAVRRLAASMVATQESESTLMTDMLAARGATPL